MKSKTYKNKCYLCGRIGFTHEHHIMNGMGFRQLCDEDKLVIRLCPECHEEVHSDVVLRNELKAMAQKKYMETHTFQEWMARYGKNYIDELS